MFNPNQQDSGRQKKISEFPESQSISDDDYVLTTKDPDGDPSTVNTKFKTIRTSILQQYDASGEMIPGSIMFDEDFLYIVISEGNIKKIPMESLTD